MWLATVVDQWHKIPTSLLRFVQHCRLRCYTIVNIALAGPVLSAYSLAIDTVKPVGQAEMLVHSETPRYEFLDFCRSSDADL